MKTTTIHQTAANGTEPLAVDAVAAAKLIGVCPRTIPEMRDAGKLPFLRIGRRVLYPVDGIRDYLNSEGLKNQETKKC